MKPLETINDVRKAIKPLGYNIKTKSVSWGRHATYIHIDTGTELNFNVYTAETLEQWRPLLLWLQANRPALRELRELTGCIGLVK